MEVNCAFVYDITEKKKLEDQLELINFSFQFGAVDFESFFRIDKTINKPKIIANMKKYNWTR